MSHFLSISYQDVQTALDARLAIESATGQRLSAAFVVERSWARYLRECEHHDQRGGNEASVRMYRELFLSSLVDFRKL